MIAPFIKHYVVPDEEWLCALLECNDCGFRFFNKRFTQKELSVLYHNYRKEAYFTVRHRFEPWYTQKVNDEIGASDDEIAFRHAHLLEFMRPLDPSSITNILDYGGDHGQFIPPPLGKNKYLYDISHVPAVAGVTSISNEEELRGRQYDFIMLCSVLEHIPYPSEMLSQIRSLLHKTDGWLYIELPLEHWDTRLVPTGNKGNLYSAYLNGIARSETALKLMDFYSTVFRIKCNFIPPLGFIRLHEHMNFFNRQSLQSVLSKNGFSLEKFSLIRHSIISGIKSTIICALAKAV